MGVGLEDRLLATAIASGRRDDLAPLRGLIPEAFLSSLAGLLNSQVSCEPYRMLARSFADMGLSEAAAACLTQAMVLAQAAADRAAILEQRASLTGSSADRIVAARLRGERCTPPLPEIEAGIFSTLSVDVNGKEHERLRDGVSGHPLRDDPLRDPWKIKPARLRKLDMVTGGAEDFSFLVLDAGRPVLHVECAIEGDGPLACMQCALRFTALGDARDAAFSLAIRRLEASAAHACAPFILVETDGTEPPVLRDWVSRFGRSARKLDWAWIDLEQTEQAIERGFRDTHRQQVRWGRSHLKIHRWQSADDIDLVYDYVALCSAEKRVSTQSGEELQRRLMAGDAALYISDLDGQPVNGVVVARHATTTYYEAGISRRVGKAPLSHAPIAQAILDARAEGQKRFHFGVLHTDPAFEAKLRSIAAFKRGFTRTFLPVTWTAVHP